MAEETKAVARAGTAGLKAILAQPAYSKRFEEIMGKRAPQFVASIISVASSLPEDTEPTSIVTSAMVAATLDLPINKDLGFAWIVPYWDGKAQKRVAQFQMGHKGFIQLALRTSQYAAMNARSINTEALNGFNDIGEPMIDWSKVDDTKEPAGYVFGWKLTNGFSKLCYWPKKRVEAHAMKYSQAFKKGWDGPWKTHFNEMALKTVIKNELSDWGILSVEMRRASQFDQGVVIDVDSEIVHYPDNNLIEEVPKAEPAPGPQAAAFRRGKTDAQKQVAPAADENVAARQAAVASEQPGNVIPIDAKVKVFEASGPMPGTVTPSTPLHVKGEVKPDPQPAAAEPTAASPAADSNSKPPQSPSPSSTESGGATPVSAAKAKTPFVLPPSKLPQDWLPSLDQMDPPAVQRSITEWLTGEEITTDEFLKWTLGRNLSKPGQKITDMGSNKLVSILKQREKVREAILEARQ